MIIEVRHAQIVSVALAVRRLRRFVPIPFLQPRAGVIAAVTAVAAACGAGIWAGFVLNELKVAASTAAGVVILVGLIAGTGSGAVWGEIRAGLVETGSWWFYADRGVAPRSFLVGRHLVSRLARLVAGLCMVLTALLILAITNDRGADINGAGWSASSIIREGRALLIRGMTVREVAEHTFRNRFFIESLSELQDSLENDYLRLLAEMAPADPQLRELPGGRGPA